MRRGNINFEKKNVLSKMAATPLYGKNDPGDCLPMPRAIHMYT